MLHSLLVKSAKKGYTRLVKILATKANVDRLDSKGYTALTGAIENGHKKIVKLLFQIGANHHHQNYAIKNLLFWAAENGHTEIVEVLIDQKEVCLNDKSYSGKTVLIWATELGHTAIVKLLLEKGADANQSDDYGKTALLLAVELGHTAIIKLLLEKGADANQPDYYGKTALILATEFGYAEIVKLLLEKGADANQEDVYGNTALMVAAKRGDTAIVKLLLETTADPNHKNNSGTTALIEAAGSTAEGNTEVVTQLLNAKADPHQKNNYEITALIEAVKNGFTKIVKLLLEAKADPNQQDKYGRTALMLAAEMGYLEIITLLCKAKDSSSINKIDNDGKTALMLAVEMGHSEAVELLLQAGAAVSQQDKFKKTALNWAIEKYCGNDSIIKLLLRAGAFGQTGLIWAMKNNHIKAAELLLLQEEVDGQSSLNWVAEKGDVKIVKLLMNAIAKVKDTQQNFTHRTTFLWAEGIQQGYSNTIPLIWAAKNGHIETVANLLEMGGDANYPDGDGKTALMWAAEKGYVEIVKLLLNTIAKVNATQQNSTNKTTFLLAKDIQQSYSNNTILIWAAKNGYIATVTNLLKMDADANYPDGDGKTALSLAIEYSLLKDPNINLEEQLGDYTELVEYCKAFKKELKKSVVQKKSTTITPLPTPHNFEFTPADDEKNLLAHSDSSIHQPCPQKDSDPLNKNQTISKPLASENINNSLLTSLIGYVNGVVSLKDSSVTEMINKFVSTQNDDDTSPESSLRMDRGRQSCRFLFSI